MKTILILATVCILTLNLHAQESDSTSAVQAITENTDTTEQKVLGDSPEVKKDGDTTRIRLGKKGITIVEKNGKSTVTIDDMDPNVKADNDEDENGEWEEEFEEKMEKKFGKKHKGFEPHLGGLELFLNNYATSNNSMSLPAASQFMELNTGRSIGVRLNIIEYGIPITNEMGFSTGLGFEFNSYCFDNDNNIQKLNGQIVTKPREANSSDYSKNKLKATYLNIPLMYEIQFPLGKANRPLYFAGGVIGGLKIGSRTKEYYSVGGHEKKLIVKDDFYLSPFRYGIQARAGFRHLHLVATYYPTPLFKDGKGPELYPFDLGLVLVNF